MYKVPENIKSEDAGPIMCAGWTVWNALVGYDLKPSDHVGVVGIGGLGHFAIQFAAKMGCEVTAFSGNASKEADALKLGAHHFVATNAPRAEGEGLKVKRPINRLLVCSNRQPDWNLYFPIMLGRGTIFPLCIPQDMTSQLSVPHMPFLSKSLNVVYSTNGRWDQYEKMLAFCALHGIRPVTTKFKMSTEGIEESLKELGEGNVRYRGVLVVEE